MASKLLYRFDNPLKKPDLSQLNNYTRFSHPRYQGRIVDLVFNEGGGLTAHNFGLLRTHQGTLSAQALGSGLGWIPEGISFAASTTDQHILLSTLTAANFPNNEATLLIYNNAQTGAADDNVICSFTTTFSTHWPYRNTGNIYVSAFHGTRLGPISITSSDFLKWHWMVIRTKNGTGTYEVYKNSTLLGSQNGEATLTLGASTRHTLGRYTTTDALGSSHRIGKFILYNRYLSYDELVSVQDAPYLEYTNKRPWYFYGAAAGGFQAAWARQSNVIIGAGIGQL